MPRDLAVAGAVLAGASACALVGASFGLVWGTVTAIGLTAIALLTLAAMRRRDLATDEDVDERRFQAMVEQVPAIAYTWDTTRPTGEAPPVYISPQLEAILGYTPQEWSDHPELWLDAMHPDDRERVRRSSDDADRAGTTFHEEYRIFAKDGRMLWLRDDSLVVARDDDGNAIRAQGVMFDITRQKQAEARLQEAENRYRTIVERVPAVAYVWDAGNEPGTAPAAYISPQIQRLLGYTPEEWFDDPNLWADRLHPEDVDGVFSRWDAAVADAGAFTAEYRIRSKAGELLWLRDEAIPVADGASGRPVYQGVMYDITEQRGTNERLQEAEERYRTLVENLPVVTYTAAADETGERDLLRYVAPGIERLTGYTPEAWTADAGFWESLIHPEDRDRVVASSRACEDTGDPFDEEYRLIRADGAVIWVHDSAVVVEHEDEAAVWQGVFEDISARKAAERAVVQAEGRYRNLVEHLPAVVYIDEIDELATAHYVSPQYERLTGYSPAHRLATPDLWVKMLHPEDRERVLAESDRTNESGEPFDIEYRIVRADGEVRWLHDHAFQVEGLDGGMAWQGVLTDVTDRKVAQDTLHRRDAILEAAGYAAERFLQAPAWRDGIDDVLARLGEQGGASRAVLFENLEIDGELQVQLRHAWLAPETPAALDRPPSKSYPYGEDFLRWQQVLASGGVIHGLVSELPERERPMIEASGIRSLVAVPVHVEGSWWGYIAFDQCDTDRVWQSAEIDAIRVVANTLGAAVGRERAASRLDETQARYRVLVEQIPAITYIEDPATGDAIYTSPQVATILGYEPGEWGTKDQWLRAIHPDDVERVLAEDDRTERTGEPFRCEYRLLAKDGHPVWMRDEAVLLQDEHGEGRYWQGVRFDITTEKAAEERLKAAEERFRNLVEQMPAITYLDVTADDREAIVWDTAYISPQVQEILGYSPEEWVADPELWRSLLHPDDRERAAEADRAHLEDGTPLDVELRVSTRDGDYRWLRDQAVMILDEQGTPRYSQGILLDVTERRLAEQQVREAEERYRAIVEHVPAAIYLDLADRSMRTVYVSPQIEAITGVSPQEWMDDPEAWLKIVPEDRDQVERGYLRAISEGTAWNAEYRMLTRDGRTIWVHDETTFLHDEDGNPTYLQGVLMDITERKLAEQALRESEQREREAAERLRALDEMKNTFLAAVSHELRSPLTSILGLSITLERTPDMDAEDRIDLQERVSSNARKLDRLLKDLLDIDRLNRGIVEPQYRTADVGALTRRAVESLDALAERTVVIDVGAVVLRVDPPKLERIVENLAMNAARHTASDRTIWVRLEPHDHGALLTVEDDGTGVDEHLREAIFEPFRQGPSVSSHSPGTGIGLSLVGRFAQLHGGRAWVEDRPGGGASFKVFLPAGPEGTAAASAEPATAPSTTLDDDTAAAG